MCSIVASWMPSSPELWTATPRPIVSQTPAALMQGRMPPQNVVSSRMTSTAGDWMFAASCSKLTTTVLVAIGSGTNSFNRFNCGIPQTGSSK